MDLLGVQLSLFQIILIIALIVILPLGLWNQKRKSKQKQEEFQMSSQGGGSTNYVSQEDSSQDEESQQIKSYILSYKNQYSRESLRAALINNGNTQKKIDRLLDENY